MLQITRGSGQLMFVLTSKFNYSILSFVKNIGAALDDDILNSRLLFVQVCCMLQLLLWVKV